MKWNKDKTIAAVCVLIGVIYLIGALSLPQTNLAKDPGPKVFPVIGAVIVILSSISIILKRYEKTPEAVYTKEQWKKAGIMLGLFIVYLLMLWIFGFLISTPVILLVSSYMFTDENVKVALWKRVIFALALTFFLYWIFAKVLVMLLPTGMIMK
ncbi:tripartite tricarboxylate transporter TctB family protein [Blautia sp.]